jgi:prolyl-tRNA synthetase
VPIRVEVGPRDLAEGNVTVVRRDSGDKTQVPLAQATATVGDLVGTVQADMLAAAVARRDAAIVEVDGIDEAVDAAQSGFVRLRWGLVRGDGEAQLAGKGITVRCLMAADGSLPATEDDDDVVAVVGRAY